MSSGDASELSRRVSVLSWDQVRRLDSILGESVPIHGRGNFPTLSVQPRQIVQVRPRSIRQSYNSFTSPLITIWKNCNFNLFELERRTVYNIKQSPKGLLTSCI